MLSQRMNEILDCYDGIIYTETHNHIQEFSVEVKQFLLDNGWGWSDNLLYCYVYWSREHSEPRITELVTVSGWVNTERFDGRSQEILRRVELEFAQHLEVGGTYIIRYHD